MDNRKWMAAAAAASPTVPASPSSGYPTDGNPGTATPATNPGAFWFHAVGEELRNVIAAAGLTPTLGTLTQLKAAMDILYAGSAVFQNGTNNRGYVVLPGGFTVQWGFEPNTGVDEVAITFEKTFPNACFVVMITGRSTAGNSSTANCQALAQSTTGFTLHAAGAERPASWLAVGN